jgi:hypothetical protein
METISRDEFERAVVGLWRPDGFLGSAHQGKIMIDRPSIEGSVSTRSTLSY